eukprot:3603379-Karenia_brevis.AAC.1
MPANTPNVFSDGALNFPECSTRALSNAAVWWPGRGDAPRESEYSYSDHNMTSSGVEVFGPLHGPSTSSSRPELL